ncbi:MAG TPA: hypothetical protein PKO06_16205 [Candidatus Ozemobacteraceae bacterium]|nr:hypothetical protein [Candidatus Ozemobacteraceae bacterium]
MSVEPEECVVFEDAPGGIEAAGRGGMRAVGITTMIDAEVFRRQPHVIHTAQQFTELRPEMFLCTA